MRRQSIVLHPVPVSSSTALSVLGVFMAMFVGGCSGGTDEPEQTSGGSNLPHYPIGAEPCAPLNSGHPGDEYCIAPPPEGKGFQLHYGPRDYSDPAEVAKFMIPGGKETTDCLFLKTPNEEPVFINQYHGRLRPGSHHMITYTQGAQFPDSDAPEGCNQGADSRFLVGSQEAVIDILRDKTAPEQEGYAMRLEPRLQAAIQMHYVNPTDEPQLKEAWINVVYADPATVKILVEPIFWLGGVLMSVDPKTTEIIKGQCATPQDAPPDLQLLQITGHFHAHTERFSAWKVGNDGARTLIYESYDYQHPGWAKFNTVDKNPMPDAGRKVAGGEVNGKLMLAPGERVEWECEVNNTSDGILRFSNAVYTAEMCNIFGTYAPSMGTTWSCVNP